METPSSARPLRVLHCPTNTGSHPLSLALAERALGLESTLVCFESNTYLEPGGEILFAPDESRPRRLLKRLGLLRRALRDFDVVHFNFGQTILPSALNLRDLPLLRAAGKGVVMTYQGDDARQGDFCRATFDYSIAREVGPDYYPPGSDERKRSRIARVARSAHRIYALNPDLLHVLPRSAEFLPYASVDPREWRPVPAGGAGDTPVVIHAPTHRGAKGTRHILAAFDSLKREGVAFELRLVENLSRAEARRLYEGADLLIDQVLAGWYGGLAVELMALGKPVVCYIRPGDLRFVPEDMRTELPIIEASPATLLPVLREWLTTRRRELPAVGSRSRAFVERWHDPRRIARQLETEYRSIVRR